jgi:hypothetical protein
MKYNIGQIVKCKTGIFGDKEMIGKIVATRIDVPDNYLITWFEKHENWLPSEKIVSVCPIETLKEAAKTDGALEELLKDDKQTTK